jgi:hypothetical protein
VSYVPAREYLNVKTLKFGEMYPLGNPNLERLQAERLAREAAEWGGAKRGFWHDHRGDTGASTASDPLSGVARRNVIRIWHSYRSHAALDAL